MAQDDQSVDACMVSRWRMGGLTFDMSGSHKWAKPACDCPFDGRVRPLVDEHDGDSK